MADMGRLLSSLPEAVQKKLDNRPPGMSVISSADQFRDEGDFEAAAQIYRVMLQSYEENTEATVKAAWFEEHREFKRGFKYFVKYSVMWSEFCRHTNENALKRECPSEHADEISGAILSFRRLFPVRTGTESVSVSPEHRKAVSALFKDFYMASYKHYLAENQESWEVFFSLVANNHPGREKSLFEWLTTFMRRRETGRASPYQGYAYGIAEQWSACNVLTAFTQHVAKNLPPKQERSD